MAAPRIAGLTAAALMLASCAGIGGDSGDPAPVAQPPDSMAGRWILSEPNAPTCGINFGGTPGVQEGPLLPEGGCPEKFFTSKSWTLSQGTLVIKNESGEPLATMTFAGGRYEGQSSASTSVTLSRQDAP